jgi:type IV secretion system protein VirB11
MPQDLLTTHPLLAEAAGPLLRWLLDDEVIEIRCTSTGACFVVRFGQGKTQEAPLEPAALDSFLAVLASHVGGEWRETAPRLHAADPRLGFRVQAGRPPISDGPWMVCRKHPTHVFPLDDFEAKGILTHRQQTGAIRQLEAQGSIRATLEAALFGRYTILVSGAVGSAKTSLTNALLHALATTEERIVILEDDPELSCRAAEVQAVHTSEQPLVTMRDLGKDLLRMSPERIVVGEVRDGAALDMLKAFQCGHPGLCTVHAASAPETLNRLEQLVQEVSLDPQRHLIGEAVDVIIHLEQVARSWRVTDLIAVDGWDGQNYCTRSLV